MALEIKKNLPNFVSATRGFMGLFLLAFIYRGQWVEALSILLAGFATDGLDGWLAARLNAKSKYGGAIDMAGDTCLVGGGYLGLIAIGYLPWLVLIPISLAGIADSSSRFIFRDGHQVRNFLGCVSAINYFFCVSLLVVVLAQQALGPAAWWLFMPTAVALHLALRAKKNRSIELLFGKY